MRNCKGDHGERNDCLTTRANGRHDAGGEFDGLSPASSDWTCLLTRGRFPRADRHLECKADARYESALA